MEQKTPKQNFYKFTESKRCCNFLKLVGFPSRGVISKNHMGNPPLLLCDGNCFIAKYVSHLSASNIMIAPRVMIYKLPDLKSEPPFSYEA